MGRSLLISNLTVCWRRRWSCPGAALVLIAAADTAGAAAPTDLGAATPGETETPAGTNGGPSESSEPYLEAAQAGLAELEAGRHQEALAAFELALQFPSLPVDRATLLFNMGGCLLALGRFDDAEWRFLESSTLDPRDTAPPRIQAGFAALGVGRIEDAKRHLAAARSSLEGLREDATSASGSAAGGAEVTEGISALEVAIAKHEAARATEDRLARCAELAKRGATELGRREYVRAQRTLEEALALSADMEPTARANLRHGAAVAAYHRGALVAARAHVERAIVDSPRAPELRLLHSRILLRMDDPSGARRSAHQAAELGASASAVDAVEAEIDAASPLPRSGWSGHLTALGGWDSNPAQSGLGAEGGLGSIGGESGSAMVSAFGGLALTGRSGEHAALRVEYTVDWLGLLDTSVSDLSAQSHGLGLRWYRELGKRWLFRLGGGGTVRLVELNSPEPMSYGLNLGAALVLDPKDTLSTELEVRLTSTEGVGEYEYLGGTRVDGRIGETWLVGSMELEAGVGARYVGLGTITFDLSSEEYPGCRGRRCAEATSAVYTVPLAYAGPRLDLGVSLDVVGSLSVGMRAEGEYRCYLEASEISNDASAHKYRRDWRWQLGAESELGIDRARHFALLAEYTWLGSSSNVDYDAADPEHDTDYGNYSFTQHLIEAGVTGRF